MQKILGVNADINSEAVIDPTRLDVKKDIKSSLIAYATTAQNGQLCFATDEKKLYQIIDGFLTDLGLLGTTGIQGETGIQGTTGFQGVTGIQGITGLQGETGIQGIAGFQGETGIQGITGIQGETGLMGTTGISTDLVYLNIQMANYTLALSDRNKMVGLTGTAPATFTLPPNYLVPLDTGSNIVFYQDGTGQLTIAGGTGVSIKTESGLKLNAQYSAASAIKLDTSIWLLTGSLKA